MLRIVQRRTTVAAGVDNSPFHNHQATTAGRPMAKLGLSQNASRKRPCSRARIIRCAPQKGQLRPVRRWSGQGSMGDEELRMKSEE